MNTHIFGLIIIISTNNYYYRLYLACVRTSKTEKKYKNSAEVIQHFWNIGKIFLLETNKFKQCDNWRIIKFYLHTIVLSGEPLILVEYIFIGDSEEEEEKNTRVSHHHNIIDADNWKKAVIHSCCCFSIVWTQHKWNNKNKTITHIYLSKAIKHSTRTNNNNHNWNAQTSIAHTLTHTFRSVQVCLPRKLP